jgi:hypothetical protein
MEIAGARVIGLDFGYSTPSAGTLNRTFGVVHGDGLIFQIFQES